MMRTPIEHSKAELQELMLVLIMIVTMYLVTRYAAVKVPGASRGPRSRMLGNGRRPRFSLERR